MTRSLKAQKEAPLILISWSWFGESRHDTRLHLAGRGWHDRGPARVSLRAGVAKRERAVDQGAEDTIGTSFAAWDGFTKPGMPMAVTQGGAGLRLGRRWERDLPPDATVSSTSETVDTLGPDGPRNHRRFHRPKGAIVFEFFGFGDPERHIMRSHEKAADDRAVGPVCIRRSYGSTRSRAKMVHRPYGIYHERIFARSMVAGGSPGRRHIPWAAPSQDFENLSLREGKPLLVESGLAAR